MDDHARQVEQLQLTLSDTAAGLRSSGSNTTSPRKNRANHPSAIFSSSSTCQKPAKDIPLVTGPKVATADAQREGGYDSNEELYVPSSSTSIVVVTQDYGWDSDEYGDAEMDSYIATLTESPTSPAMEERQRAVSTPCPLPPSSSADGDLRMSGLCFSAPPGMFIFDSRLCAY